MDKNINILGYTKEEIEKMKKEEWDKLKEKNSATLKDIEKSMPTSKEQLEKIMEDAPKQELVIDPEVMKELNKLIF